MGPVQGGSDVCCQPCYCCTPVDPELAQTGWQKSKERLMTPAQRRAESEKGDYAGSADGEGKVRSRRQYLEVN